MPDTPSGITAIRSEMQAGFAAIGQRISGVENELHRHQDEDRSDMSAIRTDIRIVTASQDRLSGRIEGSLATFKWVIGIPAFIAACGTVIGLIRHW